MAKPNILMIMVDQMRYPRFGFGKDHGFIEPLKRIFGFQNSVAGDQQFRDFFPGFTALTDTNNAVVFNNHKAASAACVPSRTALFTGQYGTRTSALQTDGVFKDGASPDFPWLNPSEFPTLGHWMRANGYTTHYFGKWHVSGEATSSLEEYGFSDWELSYPDPHGTLPNNLGYYRDYQFEDLATGFLRRQGLGVPYDVANAKKNAVKAALEQNDVDLEKADLPELPDEPKPWFAVASFTNPHDIGSYPGLPSQVYDSKFPDAPYALAVPPKDSKSELSKSGTMSIDINKLDFPQDNAEIPLTWNENLLSNKPDCQYEYSYKMGLALASKAGWLVAHETAELAANDSDKTMTPEQKLELAVRVTLNTEKIGVPFALTRNPELASRAFIQYYGYLMHEVDQHIHAVLKALDESGQADNTIVIFCPDHGEYGASHGMMMEKWHSAYEEYVHVPLVVRFPEGYPDSPGCVNQIKDVVTSHMDLLPTILGLTGVGPNKWNRMKDDVKDEMPSPNEDSRPDAPYILDPVGSDLSPIILGKQTAEDLSNEREGVLFINHDSITEPLGTESAGTKTSETYKVFKAAVEELRVPGTYIKDHPSFLKNLPPKIDLSSDIFNPHYSESIPDKVRANLKEDSVAQPSLVNCVMSNDNWKLVRYFEPEQNNPTNFKNNNQFELYDLNTDPNERLNLVEKNPSGDPPSPKVINAIPQELIDAGFDAGDYEWGKIQAKATHMFDLLKKLEDNMLSWRLPDTQD